MAETIGQTEVGVGLHECKFTNLETQQTVTTEDIDLKPAYPEMNGNRRLKILLQQRKRKIVVVCVVLCVIMTQLVTIIILGQYVSSTKGHTQSFNEDARQEMQSLIAAKTNSTQQEISVVKDSVVGLRSEILKTVTGANISARQHVEEIRREMIRLIDAKSNLTQEQLYGIKYSVVEVKAGLLDVVSSFEQEKVNQCPKNWLARDQSCYHFSHDKETWPNAMYICSLFKSHLVEINSRSENDYVTSKRKGRRLWIGINDLVEERSWKWSGSSTAPSFYNWESGEPNNVNKLENCAIIRDGSGKWHDIECTNDEYYVCEIDLS